MEEKTPMIYSAICGVMEDVGAIGKNDTNFQQKFKYRSIDAVMNALNPAMIKNKIFCTPEILEQKREERHTKNGSNLIYSVCRIRYRFFALDGSYVDSVVVGEGMDSGDKASNKALSAGFKYACFQTFCIPTEELMSDSDKDTPEENTKKPENGKKPPNQQSKPQLVTEAMIKALCMEMDRVGMSMESTLKWAKVKSLDEMRTDIYLYLINELKKRDSVPKEKAPEQIPDIPENQEGLPFARGLS